MLSYEHDIFLKRVGSQVLTFFMTLLRSNPFCKRVCTLTCVFLLIKACVHNNDIVFATLFACLSVLIHFSLIVMNIYSLLCVLGSTSTDALEWDFLHWNSVYYGAGMVQT